MDELERLGLARRVSLVQDVKKLVLKLPLVSLRPQEERDMNGTPRAGHDQDSESIENKGVNAGSENDEPDMSRQPEPDISVNNNIYTHTACARDGEAADATRRMAVLLAKVGRSAGVKIGGAQHPDVICWVADGVTPERLRQAVGRARVQIASPEWIPSKYLSRVLDSMREEDAAKSRGLKVIRGGRVPGWKDVPEAEAFQGGAVMNGDFSNRGGDDWVE
ncbi:hypothetical protein BI347_22180 [Chromobacterium sphagni]|uniref:Uncharacterized protein n=1 Tax=Chromobacterium sphagni TaxID=1903179 RepID=A0A1S1WT83_9NEIS|nr:hypothetical protein BI347_22180 [Chromobacterium sphagni]